MPAARHDRALADSLAQEFRGVAGFNPFGLVLLGAQLDGACHTCLAAAGPTPGPVNKRLEKAAALAQRIRDAAGSGCAGRTVPPVQSSHYALPLGLGRHGSGLP